MKIGNIAKIINSKVDGSLLDATTYISTENMLPDCGGVTTASSVPSTKLRLFYETIFYYQIFARISRKCFYAL